MSSTFTPSPACCTTSPIIGSPYSPKGSFISIANTNTYTAGPSDATKAIFIVYHIFGLSSQILEGADKLGEQGQYRVFMPAFFGEQPAPLEHWPMGGEEDDEKLTAFCEGPGETMKTLKRIEELRREVQVMKPEIERRGLLGYCWGGWVASYAIGKDTPFSACVQCHPRFPDPGIAAQISIALLALCSKDEPESEFEHSKPALKIEHRFETFPEMTHGWLSARGDFASESVRRDFDIGYKLMLEWFQKYL